MKKQSMKNSTKVSKPQGKYVLGEIPLNVEWSLQVKLTNKVKRALQIEGAKRGLTARKYLKVILEENAERILQGAEMMLKQQ